MRKILMMLFVMSAMGIAKAETVLYSKYGIDLLVPISQLEAVYLYDINGQRNLIGAETPLVRYKEIYGTIGTASDLTTPDGGIVYGSIHKPSLLTFGDDLITFGLFLGRDFNIGKWVGGAKSSLKFW